MSGKTPPLQVCIKNRQAHFAYSFLDRYTAGLILQGTEIKSIRMGKASLQEAYCYFNQGALWIKGMHIAAYSHGNIYNHEEKRDRQLLLQKKELQKLLKTHSKGLTIIPVELFISQRGFAKLAIALARGKKLYDKRQAIKARDLERSGQKDLI
ncbi:SsrA-binding protein [Cardinium endosymbiont of Sogatella furcifera]|uniref:SsrA-binding protein SmpB n=1 Tax=Cardinium endosymbiont of Sogatella furcifera TaxID=650378 RepID=UPI000E0D1DE2|nr:SsrA-binding protein SmpB [Cardinium endosymbiont of Sogatella furcifera]AXI24488.1 SsrA-binding protein [Cardinium endosymbiont of Sogatella furcifera]